MENNIDRYLCFILTGGFVFGVLGMLIVSLLIYSGIIVTSAPFIGGIGGIGGAIIGVLVGSNLYYR